MTQTSIAYIYATFLIRALPSMWFVLQKSPTQFGLACPEEINMFGIDWLTDNMFGRARVLSESTLHKVCTTIEKVFPLVSAN